MKRNRVITETNLAMQKTKMNLRWVLHNVKDDSSKTTQARFAVEALIKKLKSLL